MNFESANERLACESNRFPATGASIEFTSSEFVIPAGNKTSRLDSNFKVTGESFPLPQPDETGGNEPHPYSSHRHSSYRKARI
jgi:hypothetical protein